MEAGPSFDPGKHRAWFPGLAGAALLLALPATLGGDLPPDDPNRDRGRGLAPATTAVITRFEPNRVIAFLTERGEFGASSGSVAGGGFWRETTDRYIFSSGINVGAVVGGDTLVAIGGPFSELSPGSPVTPGLDVFWEASTPADRAAFPAVCTVDPFRRTVFPSLEPFAGEPFPGFAPQTKCLAVNDVLGLTCSDCAGTRLGMESAQTTFGFSVPAVQDFAFVVYRIFNRSAFVTADNAPAQAPGPFPWTNTAVAVAIDPDVGEAGDDQIVFFPGVNTMVYWDSDFSEPQFRNPPGFGGVTALGARLGSGGEVGFAEFTAFASGGPRRGPFSKEEWYRVMTGDPSAVILEVPPRDIRGMVSTSLFDLPPGEFVELYVAFFFADVSGPLPDLLLGEAFQDVATGEIIPDANDDPAFDNVRNVQRTAEAVFDAGFLVSAIPPARPEVDLIPGDGKVTVAWDGAAVEAVNPFAKVARDPFVRLQTGEPDPDATGVGITIEPGDVVFDPARDRGGTTGFVPANELGIVGREATNGAYNFECIEQMWVIRVMYLLGYHRDSQHDGDSEFLVLDVAYVDSEDLWRLARVFMSAHYDSSADKSRWWYHNELHWPDRVMGFPRVWVSEGKHANYPTHGHCEEGGFGTLDTCDEDWNWTARVEVRPQDNIGELNNQLITQVTSKISTFIYPGVECFWCSGWTFGGWLTGGTVMAYRDILNDFMITPGTWDPDIITADY